MTTAELEALFGAPLKPSWEFVVIGKRVFHKDGDEWHEWRQEASK